MKTLLILLCLLVVGGCGNEQKSSFTLWTYGDDDTFGVRGGIEVENVELGVSTVYWPEDDGDTQLYGAYALYHLPSADDAIICTYIGAQTPLNNTYYNQVAPVVGIIYDKIFFTELQYKNYRAKEAQEESKIVFGIRLKF